jgi:hypothetical protein
MEENNIREISRCDMQLKVMFCQWAVCPSEYTANVWGFIY